MADKRENKPSKLQEFVGYFSRLTSIIVVLAVIGYGLLGVVTLAEALVKQYIG